MSSKITACPRNLKCKLLQLVLDPKGMSEQESVTEQGSNLRKSTNSKQTGNAQLLVLSRQAGLDYMF